MKHLKLNESNPQKLPYDIDGLKFSQRENINLPPGDIIMNKKQKEKLQIENDSF